MSSITKQKGILIICYACILTFFILLCFFFFVRSSNDSIENMPGIFYFDHSAGEVISSTAITSQQLHDYFGQSFFQYLPLLIAVICFLILLFSGILLYQIQRLERKQDHEIASDLMEIIHFNSIPEKDSLLKREYQQINHKLLAFEEDQRRLHSYITHEQKNLIALMKCRMEESKNDKILEDIEKLSQSVDDILALSAHQDTNKNICDLAMIAAEECNKYYNSYPHLSFNFEEEKEYNILGKEQWLKRALDNLIENAIKYGNGNSIDVYLKQKYNSVLLYVEDHGTGINEEQQQHILEYGYQIHPLKKDGYGIGLSLVCHVCDLYDGFISVKNNGEKGSLFVLSFPLVSLHFKD